MRVQEKNIKGFNILELLVVIAIISIVSAAAYPNFSSWRKERELRGAAGEIKNLFSNISSQVQRGLYAFVQVDVKEDATDKTLTITSKGMRMDTLMATARTEDWTTDMKIRCNHTQTWDDEGGPDNRKLEVAELIYDNVAINFSGSELIRGTVCFSKDGTYYSAAGELETDPFFYICRRSSTNTRCDVSDGVPDEELDDVFAINWSRFGNITLEKYSKTKEDWVLQ